MAKILKTAMLLVAFTALGAGAPAVKAPELAGVVAVAPFADFSAKATDFGMLIGNPIVPTLLVAAMQQNLVSAYGRMRTDAPFYMVSYSGGGDRLQDVMIYPSVDRIARMALDNPGSEREGKDVLRLEAKDAGQAGRYAVFAADNVFTAYAANPGIARRALADCNPSVKGGVPLARVSLWRAGVRAVAAAGRAAGVTNVIDLVRGFDRLDATLDLNDRGLVLAFSAVRADNSVEGNFRERLERELKSAIIGLGGELNISPAVKVTLGEKGAVGGEVVLSNEKLKALGNDFNAFVAKQMMGAIKDDASTDKKKKKQLKHKEHTK